MVALDPSLSRPFEALKEAVQMGDAFAGLLNIEGLPKDTPSEEYIAHMASAPPPLLVSPPPILI